MQATKKRVLSVLFESIGCGGDSGLVLRNRFVRAIAPFLPGGGTTAPYSNTFGEVVLFSAAIKCAMYYVACLKTYTL